MDPITFSIIRHRLYRVIDEAVITLKHVSGSAITNEGHDLMVSLYRADGSLLMGGVGFLHHLTSAAEACKSIIRRFEGRIDEGDVFLTLDSTPDRHDALGLSEIDRLLRLLERWLHGLPDRRDVELERVAADGGRRRATAQRIGTKRADLEAGEAWGRTRRGDIGDKLALKHRPDEGQPVLPRLRRDTVGNERPSEPGRQPRGELSSLIRV